MEPSEIFGVIGGFRSESFWDSYGIGLNGCMPHAIASPGSVSENPFKKGYYAAFSSLPWCVHESRQGEQAEGLWCRLCNHVFLLGGFADEFKTFEKFEETPRKYSIE